MQVFRRLFERIVKECFDAGLVWGEELFFDATKVEANASIWPSTRERDLVEGQIEEHLVAAFPEEDAPPEDEYSGVLTGVVGPEGDEMQALARENALRHRWIAGAGRQERAVVRWGYTRMAHMRVSTTDPDASRCSRRTRVRASSGT